MRRVARNHDDKTRTGVTSLSPGCLALTATSVSLIEMERCQIALLTQQVLRSAKQNSRSILSFQFQNIHAASVKVGLSFSIGPNRCGAGLIFGLPG